jgi:class 3 adenylate cyclase
MTVGEVDEVAHVAAATWGSEEDADRRLRHAGADPDDLPGLAAFHARMNRMSCGPAAAREYHRIMAESDVRAVLPAIRTPTLIIDRATFDDRERAESQDVVSRIPGAVLERLPGPKSSIVDPEPLLASVRRFLGIAAPPEPSDTVLATVLFTDIVDSTRLQARFGDRRWKDLAEAHHASVRAQLERFGGVEQDTAGDGFYATFEGPARAVRCALAAIEAVRSVGVEVRAGVHTGECEVVDGKVGGLAVSIGARIASLAAPSDVLVSQTVKDLVAGSGLRFEDAGEHELKGVPDQWRLYRVAT